MNTVHPAAGLTTAHPDLLTGAYAADALPPEEHHAFTDHLRGCPDCADEVRSLRAATAALAGAVAAPPPVAMRADVLHRIGRVRQLPPEQAPPGPPTVGPPVGFRAAAPNPPRHRRNRHRTDAWRVGLGTLAAAALALTAVLGVRVTALSDQVTAAQARSAELTRVLTADDVRLTAATMPGGGHATLARSDRLAATMVLIDGLPAAPPGKTYQLWWLYRDGTARSAGLAVAERGTFSQRLDGNREDAAAVGLTLEPDGGSTAPTSGVLTQIAFG